MSWILNYFLFKSLVNQISLPFDTEIYKLDFLRLKLFRILNYNLKQDFQGIYMRAWGEENNFSYIKHMINTFLVLLTCSEDWLPQRRKRWKEKGKNVVWGHRIRFNLQIAQLFVQNWCAQIIVFQYKIKG